MRKEAALHLQESRFDLLEDVKTVNIGNEMAVTISIGMGYNGLSYSQNYEFARNAIDIALGRGGDQAVVKVPENVTYYGGKSQRMEKSTRVKARVKAHAFREIVAVKDEVYVMGHRMGDADSFGASVGIYRIARTLDKPAHIVLNDIGSSMQPMVDMFRDNNEYEEDMIINNAQALEMVGNNAVLVVVDVSKPSITECPELLKRCKSVVVLDHHRQGAEIIEKHFTLDRNMEGPDHKASLEPDELAEMVKAVRHIEQALGDGEKKASESEKKNMAIARKSIVAGCDIKAGDKFTEDNLTAKRPGTGLSPMLWNQVIGQTAKRDFAADEMIEL